MLRIDVTLELEFPGKSCLMATTREVALQDGNCAAPRGAGGFDGVIGGNWRRDTGK